MKNKFKVGQLVSFHRGRKATRVFSEKTGASIRYLQIKDLRDDNSIQYTDKEEAVLASENNIIIAWDGANAGTIRYGIEGALGSTLVSLKIKTEYINVINPAYLGWYLKSLFKEINLNTTGATIPHIDKYYLENIVVFAPEFESQNRIVAILDKIQSLIDKRKNRFFCWMSS